MSRFTVQIVTVLSGALALVTANQANAQTKLNPLDLDFFTHVGQGIVEQDAFIERVEGSGEVYRIAPAEVDDYEDRKLFATRDPVPYEPFEPVAGGPYAIGRDLGVTLRQWLNAQGTGSYWCESNTATVTASFEHLVPDGLYTVWYVIRPDPPTVPFTGLLSPMGDRDGSQGIFTADELGNAEYEASFEPCLEMGGLRTETVIGISLHSNDETSGFSPGSFGNATHTQLNAFLPKETSFGQ